MDQRPLTDIELDALIYGHESRGTPQQAEAWLHAYLRKYPSIVWPGRVCCKTWKTPGSTRQGQVYKDYSKRFP
jgi:hypothetical protein